MKMVVREVACDNENETTKAKQPSCPNLRKECRVLQDKLIFTQSSILHIDNIPDRCSE